MSLLNLCAGASNWVGPMMGNAQAKTPNLDKLAARGVTFFPPASGRTRGSFTEIATAASTNLSDEARRAR